MSAVQTVLKILRAIVRYLDRDTNGPPQQPAPRSGDQIFHGPVNQSGTANAMRDQIINGSITSDQSHRQ